MKIIAPIFSLIMFCCMFGFMFLTTDIIDGRNQGLPMSPVIHADTTNAVLAIAIGFMLMAMFLGISVLYLIPVTKTKDE